MIPTELIRAVLSVLTDEEKIELKDMMAKDIPEDVQKDLEEMAVIASRIHTRMDREQALFVADIKRWNELVTKHFENVQDAPEELTKI